MVSLTLQHLGHRDGLYHFFVASHEEKQQWIRAIEEAKTALRKRQGDNDVFEVRTLDDASFRYFGSVAGQGRISCSVPFGKYNAMIIVYCHVAYIYFDSIHDWRTQDCYWN